MVGRKAGSMIVGSVQHWLSTFYLGEVRWKETKIENYKHEQAEIGLPVSRRVPEMKDRVFSVGLFTAISASKAGVINYLLRVERTK